MIIYICIHYTEAERWMRPGFSHEHRIQAGRSVSFWVPLEKIQYIIYNIIYLHSIYNYIYIWTYMDVACLTVLGCNLWICSTHPGARCQQSLMLKSHRPWGQISISTSCLHILFTSAYIVYHIYIMCIYIFILYYIYMFCMRYNLHAIYYMSIPMTNPWHDPS